MINNTNELITAHPLWSDVLTYTLNLHKSCTHPPEYPFEHPWEEIGSGYHLSPAFGHWDIAHQTLDALVYNPEHALQQLLNNIRNQEPSGMIPGSIWFPNDSNQKENPWWSRKNEGHPPVWVVAVDDYVALTDNTSVLPDFFNALIRQICWFENTRKAEPDGFFYNDILLKRWESGVDEGIRFDEVQPGPLALMDATSHVYQLYHYAEKWAKILNVNSTPYSVRKNELRQFINSKLYQPAKGIYCDIWAVDDENYQHLVFEMFWPMIVGACTQQQADILIDQYLMNEDHFLTNHPIPTVSVSDKKFELRMWRGPVWNSMTYWVCRGVMLYGRYDCAKILLEKALNHSAKQFERTGTIWEFYHPHGGTPEQLLRKPSTEQNTPTHDYLGHNPLLAMAMLYEQVTKTDQNSVPNTN